jgi:transcriptional regulator with PAS, ATPase and Fis domain
MITCSAKMKNHARRFINEFTACILFIIKSILVCQFCKKDRGKGVTMDIADMVKDIVDKHPHMAALVVNRQGIIQYINETYLQVLNMPRHEVEGQDIRNITPETCTLKVLQTGKPIMGYNWVINGLRGIACSVPFSTWGNRGCFCLYYFH